jgi:hypothetical protein
MKRLPGRVNRHGPGLSCCYFAAQADVYVSCNILVYYDEGNPKKSVAPDVLVARGIEKRGLDSLGLADKESLRFPVRSSTFSHCCAVPVLEPRGGPAPRRNRTLSISGGAQRRPLHAVVRPRIHGRTS